MLESINTIISSIASWIWGLPLIILLCGTHLFLTFRLRFVQRYIFKAIKLSFKSVDGKHGDISPFKALSTQLAATMGTGNIVGVATAVALGGPGAVFWLWMTGFFGIATKYGECLLSVKYRIKNDDGSYSGGPMYVIERGLKCKWLAILFSVFTIFASFLIGSSVQANSLSIAIHDSFGINVWIIAFFTTILAGIVIVGGVRAIAKVCAKIVPVMALFYILGCVVLLLLDYSSIDDTLFLIWNEAFSLQSVGGGFLGGGMILAARYGIARGLFSNESGLGSAPIVAASAQTPNAVHQALVASTGTFWDTIVGCALTGLVVVNTGAWKVAGEGAMMTKVAFGDLPFGEVFLCLALVAFSFTTILGWSFYAEKSIKYLCGNRLIIFYRLIYLCCVFFGCVLSVDLVWNIGDIFNALMAIPNLIALLFLSGVIVQETKQYLWNNRLSDRDLEIN